MELITPPADDCIINGITRRSIIDMKDKIEKKFNLKVLEREISIHEVINSSKEGRLFEVFTGATHCSLLPVNRIVYPDTTMEMQHGNVCKELDKMIYDIMRGPLISDKWVTPFE